MTRILWLGDSAETGFGQVTREIGQRLLKLGHDVHFFNVNVDGEPTPIANRTWDLNRLSPEQMTAVLEGHYRDKWQPEIVILLADYLAAAQKVAGFGDGLREAFYRLPVLHYVPVEGRDIPNHWSEFWRYVAPVAMSQFGAQEIERVTGRRPPVIYHGVDTHTFHPATVATPLKLPTGKIRSKREAKIDLGLNPDHIYLFRADRHMPRKRYNAMLRALTPLLGSRTDIDLVIHCRPHDQGGNLEDAIRKLPTWARPHVMLTKGHDTWRGLSPEKLVQLYNAADIYINSGAEGFGLCIAESIACGTPAVGIDYSAVPEVIGPAGMTYPIAYEYDNEYDHLWAAPDEGALAATVCHLIDNPDIRMAMGAKGPAHVREHFNWDTAARQFHELVRGMV